MINSWATRSARHRPRRSSAAARRSHRLSFVLLLALLATSVACGSSQPAPQTTPARPEPGVTAPPVRTLASLTEEAESYFAYGEEAYRRGEFATADERFTRALDVYLDAHVTEHEREALQAAFNDMFNRIHALTIEGLVATPDELVSIDDEELPAPSEEDLARLRARLEVTPPELPKFSMPIPGPVENERVEWALAYLSGDRKEVIEEGLSRATAYMPMIEAIFDEVGIPRELAWSALIESLFKNGAYSRAAAVGMWQFVSGTARLYGMQVTNNVDERRDPVRATRMAAIYMRDLYEEFGDWSLVLAAYNAGKGRLGRAMQRTGHDDFWSLSEARALPRETSDHVPKIYAAVLIGTDPEYYGFNVVPQPIYTYDESVMETNTDLRLVAELAGISFEELRELNPHIMAWVPKGYPVRIPAGSKGTFETALAAVPPGERIEFLTHVVARGDTLGAIASQYGTRVNDIMEANNLRNANRLSINQRLYIPVGPETRAYRAQPVAGFDTGERTTYRVQRGDTLYDIAQNFRTDSTNLMRWNDLASNRIYPGDTLIVYYGVRGDMATPAAVSGNDRPAAPASADDGDAVDEGPAAERGLYTVRPGDSLYMIASRYDVSIDQLKGWNDRRGNTIHPGDKLVVYSPMMATQATNGGGVTSVQRHTVNRGDSAYEIAQRYDVDLDALLAANGLTPRSSIYPGDELLIPGGGASSDTLGYTVRRGDTLGAIATRHGVSLSRLLQANGLSSRSVIHPGDTLTIPGR
jgi:membrane-bound lytic murein transglycosylase D